MYGYGSLKQRKTCLFIHFDHTTKLLQWGGAGGLNHEISVIVPDYAVYNPSDQGHIKL